MTMARRCEAVTVAAVIVEKRIEQGRMRLIHARWVPVTGKTEPFWFALTKGGYELGHG